MSAEYKVRVRYVDCSYWDDGSRWTRDTFKFSTQKEAIAFAREALKKGCNVKGAYSALRVHPAKEDITIERLSTIEVNWAAE